jgi:hypothetical protein
MKIFARTVKTMMVYIFALLLAVSTPLSVMAEGEVGTTQTVASTPASEPSETYTYDASTGRWNTDKWYYDSTTGTYQQVVKPTEVQPTIVEQPVIDPSITTPTIISPPQTDNGSVPDQQNSAVTSTDSTNQTTASNAIDSQAQTGNATVISNTTASNATTGDATDTATVLNNVNSVLSTADNQKAATFVTDVMGDVNGDILLQPMLLKAMLETGSTNPTSISATVKNDSTLTNDINLNATTGNAGVIGNTTAGNATSGSANTVANVVNIINSMIAANQSFVGTVNIYGNLNGDILIAPDFIPQLIASNGGTADSKQASPTVSIIDSKDMQSVINNVSLAAESGKAAVVDNTSAGNATSGNANTNIVIFNLSGHEIVASNSLLVFINVLGKWVGVIVDAPVGATAAAIGNGVTADKTVLPDLTIVSNNNSQITNNISLASKSGNATVAGNTLAGNATSGNATASVNIANVTGSQFGLSGWFGILFINVFGSWYGSFGIDTARGNPVNSGIGAQASNTSTSRVIEFIPSSQKSSDITLVSANGDNGYSVTNMQNQQDNPEILGTTKSIDKGPGISPVSRLSSKSANIALLAGSTFLVIISAAGLNRLRFIRKVTA